MCQINYTTENKKNKPLDEFELSKIETMLNEWYNATQIAEALERDASTIQKEIKNFSIIVKTTKECKVCEKFSIIENYYSAVRGYRPPKALQACLREPLGACIRIGLTIPAS